MKNSSTSAAIRRRSPGAEGSWRSAFLSVMLLAAIICGALYVEVAQAQGVDGAITGLTLSSEAPGTLTVSWDAASPVPTDYRVDWAKSTEEYKSWTVDDGHVYPAETATAATITDLSHDTQYKVRLRARYYTGEHKGNSWGGPWATATIIVAGEPAETPTPDPTPEPSPDPTPEPGTITGLTLTSDVPGTLTVSWETASPTPTDYRIDWATFDEDYQSWTVDEGHQYPAETATAATIADLSHDTQYKVRLRARYYTGEHSDKSWGGPWATATITVAGEPAETPTPEPGTIDTLAATDDDTGQLVLTWGPPAAPNAAPTDYHLNWAKSTESYPADTAEAGNAHPDSTTHTLAGLDYNTDYNIRVRARYTDGENADSPWNGPWTETTAQVKLPLPMALNIMGAAVSPEGRVFLFWSDPSDDSITGYQVLRGPDADSLVVIEDDTGSTGTSYTDATPPAGETHTYAVKARNASGLSPLSDTVTATVPAAKKEEVLIVGRHESNNDTLVSNLRQVDLDSSSITIGPYQGNQYKVATSFTTGDNALGYHPTGAQLYLGNLDAVTPTPDISIREDNAGLPSNTVLSSLTTATALIADNRLITFTTSNEVTLQPNTKYWLHATATGTRARVQQIRSDGEDNLSQAGWLIGNTGKVRVDEESWVPDDDNASLRMSILGHGISPDPNDGTPPGVMESVSEPSGGDLVADTTTIGRLALNGSVTGRHQGSIHDENDADWFAFMAEANTNYQFTANQGKKGLPYYILRIFNDEGVELRNSSIKKVNGQYSSVDRLNVLPFRTHTAGTYYVSIESWHGNGSAVAYTLAMSGDDYSDDVDTTATVTVDESGRNFEDFQNYLMRTANNPESSRTSDVDWIRVSLEASATYEIIYHVACLHEGHIVGIYDSTGTLIPNTEAVFESNKKIRWCGDITTRFTPESDGDHYIAVTARGANFPHRPDGGGLHLNNHWNPFTGVQGTLSITVTSPPSTAAKGDPLAPGERKVGSTLAGDIKGITDVSGLTTSTFNYRWQRMEAGEWEYISGAESETYTLIDDDLGKRVRLQVRFNDDEGTVEMRTGPGTSVITKEPHLLVGNISQNPIGHLQMPGEVLPVQSTGFNTGAHDLGYIFDSATAYRGKATPVNDGDEIRIHGSTSEANAIDRRPSGLTPVVAASDFLRQNGLIVAYSARSRAKLDPSTTYHIFVATLDPNDEQHSCRSAEEEGLDSGSLPGFSINDRTYATNAATLSTISSVGNACAISIKGSELQSSNFLQDLEFTSSPAQPMIYATGETIEVTATLNQAVTFDGPPPVLLLQIGDNQREMTYVASESTGSSWVFRYTVTADDRDDDGMSFNYFALQGYADADLSNNRVINDPEHLVNAVSQIVSRRVSSKPIAPMWYGPGEKIQFTLGFSLQVTVVGDPQLEFNVSVPDGPEFMSYESGSDTKELVFSYTVGTSDDDDDGIWWDDAALRLDSDDSITGTINGLVANLNHTGLNKLENHRIDQNPRAVSQEVTSDPMDGTNSDTYGAGDAITFEVVFNQLVTVNGAPRLRFSITGQGDEYATYVSGSGTNTLVFSYTVLATEMDTDGIYLYMNPLDYPDANVDSIVGTSNNLDAVNDGIGKEGVLSGHKVDGTITN